MNNSLFLCIFLSATISYFLTKFSLPFFRNYFIDIPNYRSSHILPTPKGGGLIFVLVGTFFSLIQGNYIPILCLPLAIVGLIDDYLNINNLLRYTFQFSTAVIIFLNSNLNIILINSFYEKPIIYTLLLCLISFAGTAIINFINFMDGIDGLVVGSFLIIFISASILLEPSFLVIFGSILPFIIFNWHPAKLFMGDVGSTFLGALLFSIIVNFVEIKMTLGILISASPLLIDPAICILRRYLNGFNIFKAHRMHLYQRLTNAGWKHSKVAIIYISTIFLFTILLLMNEINNMIIFLLFVLSFGVFLDKNKASVFPKKDTKKII